MAGGLWNHHFHEGRYIRTRSLKAYLYEDGPLTTKKRSRPRSWGTWCPVCGFKPNERAQVEIGNAMKRVNKPNMYVNAGKSRGRDKEVSTGYEL